MFAQNLYGKHQREYLAKCIYKASASESSIYLWAIIL